jgi:hypothetical protein
MSGYKATNVRYGQFENASLNLDNYEQELREEFECSINERLDRYNSVRPWQAMHYTDFGPVSSECNLLYRDGYFFASIALCQSVAESLSRFLYRRICRKIIKDHMIRVKRLKIRGRISAESEVLFESIHKRGNEFYHLNSNTDAERERLKDIAFEVLKALSKIEGDVFAFFAEGGILVPKHPDLWNPKTLKALRSIRAQG